jgi:HSP20 family molecular chaperone IbpA
MPALLEARTVRRRSHISGPAVSAASHRDAAVERPAFSRPRHHIHEQLDTLRLVVHIPGVDPTGIDLEVDAPDLTITATHQRATRAPRESSPLAEAARDYQLRLRLGFNLAYQALQAELHGSTLTVTIPKAATPVALAS